MKTRTFAGPKTKATPPKTKSQQTERGDILREISRLIDRLAEMEVGAEDDDPDDPELAGGLRIGMRIRVTIKDKYYGRLGTVVGPHGPKFVDLMLDKGRYESKPPVIHKMPTSLEVLPNSE